MELTSSHCLAQEAAQRERAAETSLENVRIVAERAAIAWKLEAIAARQREARHARTRAISEMESLKKRRKKQEDLIFSENPDRGMAQV